MSEGIAGRMFIDEQEQQDLKNLIESRSLDVNAVLRGFHRRGVGAGYLDTLSPSEALIIIERLMCLPHHASPPRSVSRLEELRETLAVAVSVTLQAANEPDFAARALSVDALWLRYEHECDCRDAA